MIRYIIKRIYILIKKIQLKNRGCIIQDNVSLDFYSNLRGNNLISSGTCLRNVDIGIYSYTGYGCLLMGTKIGKYTSIGPGVKTAIGSHPTEQFVSTHPLFYTKNIPAGNAWLDFNKYEEIKYAINSSNEKFAISIGNDVWIGANVTIVDGVTIGDGAVVGAGAVVLHDVEPYSIVVGVPAKCIRKRFPEKMISKLLCFEWWNNDECWIKENVEYFDNIDIFLKKYGNK